jgi:hypothetical protein
LLPEWIVSVIEDPYDQWEEVRPDGRVDTIVVGRVSQVRQWIRVVFAGTGDSRELLTAYQDRRLAAKYGGGPWQDPE